MRSLILAVPLLGACAGDPGAPAPLSSASDAQLARVFEGAALIDATHALLFVEDQVGTNTAVCPPVSSAGNLTTITGGCTTPSTDWRWDGSITFDNSGSDAVATFDGFGFQGTVDGAPVDLGYAGDLTIVDADTQMPRLVSHLTVTWNGIAVHTGGEVDVDLQSSMNSIDETIALTDLGKAEVDGTWTENTGSITVHGDADLVIDVASFDADTGCARYTLGDRAGSVCSTEPMPPITTN